MKINYHSLSKCMRHLELDRVIVDDSADVETRQCLVSTAIISNCGNQVTQQR